MRQFEQIRGATPMAGALAPALVQFARLQIEAGEIADALTILREAEKTNPALQVLPEAPFIAYYGYGAGVVRLSLGDNEEMGGANRGGGVYWNFIHNATVMVGDRVLVKEGKVEPAKSYYHRAIYGLWPRGAADDRTTARFELIDLLASTDAKQELLAETIERGEAEAVQRIQASLADVQRRQIEQLERTVARAGAGFSDEATLQFANLIKRAREDAARRLARELERAVNSFAREAEGVLAEQLAHVGDAGAQRLERRLAQITGGLERQREEFVQAFQSRLAEAEDDLRRRLSELAADAEAERAILAARLQELARRIDETATLRAG